MSNPIWVTPTNVKFNGQLTDAVILKQVGNVKNLIVWNNYSGADQQILIDLVDTHGGVAPMVSASSGSQVMNFGGSVIGATTTGLSSVSTTTAGKITINIGGDKLTSSASGLSAAAGTHGSQSAQFTSNLTNNTVTGLSTAGKQYITFSAISAGAATNLVSGTTYTATITVDGVAKAISILGSDAATFSALVSEINTDLGVSATATLDTSNKRIVITSATYGTTSSVAITADTLFAAPLSNFTAVATAIAGTGSVSVPLTATITVDGTPHAVSVLPSVIPTYAMLVAQLNSAVGALATVALAGSNIVVTSSTVGTSSNVAIAAGTLFPALTKYVKLNPTQNGGGSAGQYSAVVTIDSAITKIVRFTGLAGDTIAHVLSEINTDLGASATATLVGGNIVITSATTGISSSVAINDIGLLFHSLTGYVNTTTVNGTAPTIYTTTITVDGVAKSISIQGSAAQTFTTLVSEINTDLDASATATISGGNVIVTSATTGVNSKVIISTGTLFKAISLFRGVFAPVSGVVNLLDALKATKAPNGTPLSNIFNVQTIGNKPAVPPYATHSITYSYWDGTDWRYLDNDAVI